MNSLVTLHEGQPFTSTLAIAEGTENEHASVLKVVRVYMADFESFGNLRFEIANQSGHGGRPTEMALLNEQQSTLLLTYLRNSEVTRGFKRKLVHAFFEMAERLKSSQPSDFDKVLSNPAAMRGLLLNYTEKVLVLEGKVAEQAPKVIALDRIAETDGTFNLRESAKVLQLPERKFIAYLQGQGWIFRHHHGKQWLGYSDKTKSGYLTHKFTEVKGSDGEPKVVEQVRLTNRGIARLSVMLGHQEQISLAG